MSKVRHLSRAPLTEALINFQVDASDHWKPDTIKPLLVERWAAYPDVQPIRPFELQFVFSIGGKKAAPDPPKPGTSAPPLGFIFKSPSTVLQARRDGFTFSYLSPYTDWETLQSSALSRWADFQQILQPKPLHGLSVRFINRLEFELEGFASTRYFAAPPPALPNNKWKLDSFQQRAIYAPPQSPCIVRVNTAPAFVSDPSRTVAFMLDIEVALKESFSATDRDLVVTLAEMHDLKNEAFFNLLTEDAIKHYI